VTLRVEPALWDRFGDVAQAQGVTRAELLREWIRWAVGESGAKPPRRPEQPPHA
jgi:hypothetical protein